MGEDSELIIKEITISDLRNKKFYVPNYQRGYRWGEYEVKRLLEDVYYAKPDENNYYYLQPIILAPKENGNYELVDGQQRLTTLLLILNRLNYYDKDPDYKAPYTIEYQTREETAKYIFEIPDSTREDISPDNAQNIDEFHILSVVKAIDDWFDEKREDLTFKKFSSKIGQFFDYIKLIWYQPSDSNHNLMHIFRSMNSGKIPLTGAELLRSFFITGHDNEQRIQIGNSFDSIENDLNQSEFWYFTNSFSQDLYTSKIMFLFEIYRALKDNTFTYDKFLGSLKHSTFENRLGINTFQWYENTYGEDNKIDELFSSIKDSFTIIDNLYRDVSNFYNLIGYLIHCKRNNKNFIDIIRLTQGKNKEEMKKLLCDFIKNTIPEEISSLEPNKSAYDVLLLSNIHVYEKLNEDENLRLRFPFYFLVEQKWDIEHIFARNDSGNQLQKLNSEERKKWLETIKTEVEDATIRSKIDDSLSGKNGDQYRIGEELYRQVMDDINKKQIGIKDYEEKYKDEDFKNQIGNYCLLSKKINISLSNLPFNLKQKKFIDYDLKGHWVMPNSKNVFLKAFTPNQNKPYWSIQDIDKYSQHLDEILNDWRKK